MGKKMIFYYFFSKKSTFPGGKSTCVLNSTFRLVDFLVNALVHTCIITYVHIHIVRTALYSTYCMYTYILYIIP